MTKDPAGGTAEHTRCTALVPQGPYAGAMVVMGTKHGKEDQVDPVFGQVLGARVLAPPGLDTDRFGMFTGEVERTLTPIQAATAKARLAMTTTGEPYGIASEASYTTQYGVLAVHEEILLFLDDTRGIEVIEGENNPNTPGSPGLVTCVSEAALTARRFGFPQQGAAVKLVAAGRPLVLGKGLTEHAGLTRAVQTGLDMSDTGQVWVEPDLRAHHNPSRRQVLVRLAGRLAHRLATPCPACHTPGYGKIDVRRGLPCAACGWPTSLITADIHGCPSCDHQYSIPRNRTAAEPRWCDKCNP